MKKAIAILVALVMAMSMIPMAFAVSTGTGVTPEIITEDFPPLVWLCDHRFVEDDATEPGRISQDNEWLVERINNYAFEGEEINWLVLVMDKNGVEKIKDVFGTIGDTQGAGNDIEVNCQEITHQEERILPTCNARIGEEVLREFDPDVMQYYECTLTVETAESMYGEYWITVEAEDLDGLTGIMAENEYWFLNPIVGLSVNGELTFEDVRPGTDSYSSTLLLGNDAEDGSGVLLDMFISGTDFYDSSSSGAMCPTTNQLALSSFRYFATNGAYSTAADAGIDVPPGRGDRNVDIEGYVNIGYGIGFNNPTPFYDAFEILQVPAKNPPNPYWLANILAPGAEMALTFKLSLPEPCNGDFDSGAIYFWGEAI